MTSTTPTPALVDTPFQIAQSVSISRERAKELIQENETFHFGKTPFHFINDHFGLKPGKMHTFLGKSGAGKSALQRALTFFLSKKFRVFLYATEETLKEYQTQLAYLQVNLEDLGNLKYFHESEMVTLCGYHKTDPHIFHKKLNQQLDSHQPEIFVLDNLTTSEFYNALDPNAQSLFINTLRDGMKKRNIPYVMMAHTRSTLGSMELISADDVRGAKTLTMTTEHLYAIQDLYIRTEYGTEARANFVRILKDRTGPHTGSVYHLSYDMEKKLYTSDERIAFQKFNSFWLKRVRLGSTK